MIRLLTYAELSRCNKAQLWDLHFRTLEDLRTNPSDSDEYKTAYLNLQHIRLFLARRSPSLTPC